MSWSTNVFIRERVAEDHACVWSKLKQSIFHDIVTSSKRTRPPGPLDYRKIASWPSCDLTATMFLFYLRPIKLAILCTRPWWKSAYKRDIRAIARLVLNESFPQRQRPERMASRRAKNGLMSWLHRESQQSKSKRFVPSSRPGLHRCFFNFFRASPRLFRSSALIELPRRKRCG